MDMQIHNQGIFGKDNVILKLMRNYYLMDLVSNDGERQHNLKQELSYLKLNPSFTFPVLAVVDSTSTFLNEREKRKYMEGIIDFLQHQAGDNIIVFMDVESHIGLLFSWVSKDFIEFIHDKLNEHFKYPVSIGVGKPCNRLENVHQSYHQALLALQDKFYKGLGQIVYYSELSNYQELSNYPLTKEKELYEFIRSAEDCIEIEFAVEDFYQYFLQNGLIDKTYIYELTIRLLVGIEKRVQAELGEVSACKNVEIMSIVRMETFQELRIM
ncbi:hypothetical protein [Metabacillus sp. Hm71]|uniref:hypothetical protein n=1 Tax=Metabacillus sp. Hm71 TaxID=3450743 RepID=UPI003F42AFDF